MPRRILITGSQRWTDKSVIRDALAEVWLPGTILMSGACKRGADRFCEDCWTHWGGPVDRFPAQWMQDGRYHPGAGFRRNAEMVAAAADLGVERCLAFLLDDSPGTANTITLARSADIWTTVYRATTEPAAPAAGLNADLELAGS